ncbi:MULTISPECIES: phage tail protein [unclassified Pseudomonas]|uniref:TipJ family phage tail tip protein n=1 Tax=unclassified Pseudomonas TaxID=196821 RepID=UPI000A1E8A30|nr:MULTISPECIES: phage tail protein [unclassified Pseudomonas]
MDVEIHGAKGGQKKPKMPYEAADSLRSTNLAKILIAVGEGEFEGTPTARDIYLDNTPIQDASGSYNFTNVKWEWRPGSVDQDYIPGIPSVENETSLNIELRSGAPWVQSISNTQLSAVRVRMAWPALQAQDNEGNVNGYRIEYAIDVATDGGAYQQVLAEAVDGKSTSRYERSRRIDLPSATSGWQIRVRRITPNQNTNKVADTMLIAGYTQVIDAKIRYPNTALLYIEFDAEQFTNIPAVTVKCKARKWQVPSNYDPVARTYSGIWDGTMKQAWTNNPAWITFGICTENRFGLGKRIKSWMVDKWELYRIAQYCDQLVSNGLGGQEPRFLCDMNLQGKADAWSLLRDIAGIYRGMTCWAQGQLVMQADMPRAQDIDYVFTRSNVVDGKFSYGSASAKTRYTRCLVSYDNPANNYDTDVIPYADIPLQRRFGDKPTEISAIGCTRASEAQRRAKWAILSNNQDRTVTFKTGMEGQIPLPGFIIPVADSLLAGREVGGRIAAAAGRVVTLDRDTQAKAGDRLIINLPAGRAEGRTVQSVKGRQVTVTTAYSESPAKDLQWALDADDLAIPLYRVLRTARTPEGDYEISALQYEPSKYASIDTGARLEERPISIIPVTTVPAPTSVALSSDYAIDQGLAVSTMTIAWPAVSGAVGYDVEWRKDSGNWIKLQRTGSTSVDVTGIYAGAYLARVRAVSAFEISSTWKSSDLTQLKGKDGVPPAVAYLNASSELFGIKLKWGFPAGAEDTQRTEIWYGAGNSLEHAAKLSDLAYPQSDFLLQGLAAGATFFFWARLVDRTGNVGPFYPAVNGVRGQASSDADLILDYIKGKIDESSLGQHLKEEIDKISGDGPGSINERLEAIKDLIKQYTDALAWDPAKTYSKGEIVRQGQNLYQALGPVPAGTQPPNAQYWKDVGTILEEANALAGDVHNLTQQITNIDGKVKAVSEKVDGVFVQLNPPMAGDSGELVGQDTGYAGVWSVWSAVAEGDYVQAKRTDIVEADLGKANARVTDLTTAMVTADSALGERITQVDAKVGQNTAAIRDETKARVDAVGAVAQRTSTVETNLNGVSLKADEGLRVAQEANGKFSQMWSVRLQYNSGSGEYKFAGIALSIENGPNGVVQSKFVIDADMFAIQQGGSVPFAVEGGQVFMKSAFIKNGSIDMLKIGSNLTSSNYVKDVSGWAFLPDGTFQMMGQVGGGNKLMINNSGIYIYYPNGVKAIDLSVDAS